MNKFYFALCITLLVACGNRTGTGNTESDLHAEEVMADKETLDSALVRGVLKLVQSNEHLKYPEIPLNESFIDIGFLYGGSPLSDSIVSISYFYDSFPIEKNLIYYKGMLNIEGYNVAIFDFGNFGDIYYNADSLKQISLDGFKSYPAKNILTETFCIHNRQIIRYVTEVNWSPQDEQWGL